MNNQAAHGGGIFIECYYEHPVAIRNCIVYGSSTADGPSVACSGCSQVSLNCCDFFQNAAGDSTGCLAGQIGANGNTNLDPRFCDPANADYHLRSDSPCAPGGSSCGGVGAYLPGCP